jgi:Bacterial capsule synthesis protein PGA_cap
LNGTVELVFVGDLILDAPEPASYFDHCREAIAGDVCVAQVEWPHTDRGQVCALEVPAPGAPPENLAALPQLGFGIATLASNHTFDQGPFGVLDTITELRRLGVATVGSGMTLEEARRPAVVEAGGLRIGVLSYNAVGPRETWATSVKSGAAFVRISQYYEVEGASPGSPATEFTSPDYDTLEAMQADIRALAAEVDVVAVAFHKGVAFVRAELAQYERPLARAAIDAGADIVVGHHAHILKGVEVYRDRPIFHGINHFVVAYAPTSSPASPEAAARRPVPGRSPIFKQIGEPDRTVLNFPYRREARHTMAARIAVDADGIVSAGFVPCWIDEQARPVAHGDDEQGRETAGYVEAITREAGLDTPLHWRDGRVVFYERATSH